MSDVIRICGAAEEGLAFQKRSMRAQAPAPIRGCPAARRPAVQRPVVGPRSVPESRGMGLFAQAAEEPGLGLTHGSFEPDNGRGGWAAPVRRHVLTGMGLPCIGLERALPTMGSRSNEGPARTAGRGE